MTDKLKVCVSGSPELMRDLESTLRQSENDGGRIELRLQATDRSNFSVLEVLFTVAAGTVFGIVKDFIVERMIKAPREDTQQLAIKYKDKSVTVPVDVDERKLRELLDEVFK